MWVLVAYSSVQPSRAHVESPEELSCQYVHAGTASLVFVGHLYDTVAPVVLQSTTKLCAQPPRTTIHNHAHNHNARGRM